MRTRAEQKRRVIKKQAADRLANPAQKGPALLGAVVLMAALAAGLPAQESASPAMAGAPSSAIVGLPITGLPGGAPSSALAGGSPQSGLPGGAPARAFAGTPNNGLPAGTPSRAIIGTSVSGLTQSTNAKVALARTTATNLQRRTAAPRTNNPVVRTNSLGARVIPAAPPANRLAARTNSPVPPTNNTPFTEWYLQ
jgi:hypothetical protein